MERFPIASIPAFSFPCPKSLSLFFLFPHLTSKL